MVKQEPGSVFDAIADPTRRAILDQMQAGEISAGELSDRFPISRPAVSRHLKILRRAGLVDRRVQAQQRFYSLRPEGLAAVDHWLAPYRLFWSARLIGIKTAAENDLKNDDSQGQEE